MVPYRKKRIDVRYSIMQELPMALKTFGIDKIIIADNDFLFKALDCFKTILVCVDDAFTQQKYVENRELPKSTQKVLKTKSVENQGFMLS